VTADEVADPAALDMMLSVNGTVRQKANTRDLVVGIPQLIAWASRYYTLHPGDIILTGTPEGVGPVVPGDEIIASIDGIGTMKVSVSAA
jgi:2-keto-4-pentenoate hydratase/2-oxohepta-3-ene-1,7-dioic acid hydratase in catechol pathway